MEPEDGTTARKQSGPSSIARVETFNREQAERVLGRAAAMQLSRSDDEVSLVELEHAAAEAGIDAALVVRAARELAPQLATPARRAGMQTRMVRRRWLGRRLDRPTVERMLARLDALFGAQGERAVHGESASWSARHIHVTFEAQGEGTLVQVSEHFINTANSFVALGGGAGGTMGLMIGAVLAKSLLGWGKLSLLAAFPVAFVFGMLGIWFLRHRHSNIVKEAALSFEQALDSLETLAGAETRPLGTNSPAALAPSSRIRR